MHHDHPRNDHLDFHDGHSSGHGFSRRSGGSRDLDLRDALPWVKAFVWIGVLLAIAGFVIIAVSAFGQPSQRKEAELQGAAYATGFATETRYPPYDPGMVVEPPEPQPIPQVQPPTAAVTGPNFGVGGGLFLTGFVVFAIGLLGHSTSKRR